MSLTIERDRYLLLLPPNLLDMPPMTCGHQTPRHVIIVERRAQLITEEVVFYNEKLYSTNVNNLIEGKVDNPL